MSAACGPARHDASAASPAQLSCLCTQRQWLRAVGAQVLCRSSARWPRSGAAAGQLQYPRGYTMDERWYQMGGRWYK
jgi:hypothetical protein